MQREEQLIVKLIEVKGDGRYRYSCVRFNERSCPTQWDKDKYKRKEMATVGQVPRTLLHNNWQTILFFLFVYSFSW